MPATITMLLPGFPKSPASAASQASFVIDTSSVISFFDHDGMNSSYRRQLARGCD
jgi:hypothetical protein